MSLCRSATFLLFLAFLLTSTSVFGQEPEPEIAIASEDEDVDDEGGVEDDEDQNAANRDYAEVEQLRALENDALQPRIAGESSDWSQETLAPFRGAMAGLHMEMGLGPDFGPAARRVPTGSQLLQIDSVRQRMEETAILGLAKHDNAQVRAYLDFFDRRGKATLARWYARMHAFEPMIREVLAEAGLPQDLIYVAMIESGFSPRARSSASAMGIWQFMAPTGRDMGLRIDAYVDERRDPVKATRAAAQYLGYLHEKYGSWGLALASYNGGPGMVDREMSRWNTNDLWFMVRQNGLYDETRRYVPKVVAVGLMAKNPDIFGLDAVETEAPWDYETVPVPGGLRLAVVATATGTSVEVLSNLNPELLRLQAPPGEKPYMLRIPSSTVPRFVEHFDKIVVAEGKAHELHEVRFGESLAMIAENYGVAPHILRHANGLAPKERAPYGRELIIPASAKGKWQPRAKQSGKPVIIVPAKTVELPDRTRFFYTTQAGDTLEALGIGLGLNPSDIALWNNIDPKAHLRPGLNLQLYLPTDGDTTSSLALMNEDAVTALVVGSDAYVAHTRQRRATARRVRYHTVRPNESLWLIARRHKTTVANLRSLNRTLRNSNTLQPGQRIVVGR